MKLQVLRGMIDQADKELEDGKGIQYKSAKDLYSEIVKLARK